MKLAVVGSGSRGNAVALRTHGATLLVDAGFGARTIVRRLGEVNWELDDVCGVIVTHEHGDHSRGVASVAKRFGCAVHASRGTLTALDISDSVESRALSAHVPVKIGGFDVVCCPTTHDAREPLALLIAPSSGGPSVGIAYDFGRTTSALRYLFTKVSCLVIESNYDEVMLRTGPYPPSVQHRIAGSSGHLSNRGASAFAADVCHDQLERVVLVHVSDKSNTPELAERAMRAALQPRGFKGEIHVASQDRVLGPLDLSGGNEQLELEAV
ncbi:MAG: MBL fold metallo-hydrolase [Gemmatimonadales bacterium]